MDKRRDHQPDRPTSPAVAAAAPADGDARLVAAASAELVRWLAQPPAPGLHLVATPIGNLGDMTLRALAVLARADLVLAEDTRHSRTLLAHFALAPKLSPYHEHNAETERPRLLRLLGEGRSLALITDAGMPLVSDPGFKLARAAIEAGHHVTAVPGASAVLAAASLSGLPMDEFHFAGFLPSREGQRRARLAELAAIPATLVLFESPNRLAAAMADVAAVLGERQVAVARELTKRFEEVQRGPASEIARWAADAPVRGEIAIVVGPPIAHAATDAEIEAALRPLLPGAGLKDAAREVASRLGIPRARAYDIGLALKDRSS